MKSLADKLDWVRRSRIQRYISVYIGSKGAVSRVLRRFLLEGDSAQKLDEALEEDV